VILEGIFALYWPELRNLLDFKIFIEVDEKLMLLRRAERDTAERGREKKQIIAQLYETVLPMNKKHVLPTRKYADLILGGEDPLEEVTDRVIAFIKGSGKQPRYVPLRRSRAEMIEQLYQRYRRGAGGVNAFSFKTGLWMKKTAWLLVIGGARLLKRLIDMVLSSALLLLLAPLFLIVALLIKATDSGPVFYVQERIGRWGVLFRFPKFRSMVMNADKMKDALLQQSDRKDGVTFKMKRDPRVTWIGRIIRRFSIDELPQIWCILKGDMSLVGPRPPVPREVALYTLTERRRLDVTPGLTGIWQVSGRADIPFPQQVELDVQYIESQSVWLDIKVLLQTIPAVLTGKGAY